MARVGFAQPRPFYGAVSQYVFVKEVSSPGGLSPVQQAGAGDAVAGIAQMGSSGLPGGSPIDVAYEGGANKRAKLKLGGTVHRGDHLKSDANACGVVGTIATDKIGARALQDGGSGDVIDVEVVIIER